MKNNILFISVLAALNQFVFQFILLLPVQSSGRSQVSATTLDASDTSYRARTDADAAAKAKDQELLTIQQAALAAQKNTNKGKSMANAAIAVTTAGVIATCWAWKNSACNYFVGGLVASIAVRALMGGASGQSSATANAVTTTDDPYNLGKGSSSTTATPDYTTEPEYVEAKKTIAKLQKDGWKIDTQSGTITTPSGKTYSSSVSASAASMKASGASDATIKEYQSAMDKIPAVAAAKAADSGSSIYSDDSAVGSVKTAASATGLGEGTSIQGGLNTAAKAQGISRDPAQVAGLATTYNGSPIGVSADSLFDMIERRYQLHNKNGAFLNSGK